MTGTLTMRAPVFMRFALLLLLLSAVTLRSAEPAKIEAATISSLAELASVAAHSGKVIRMKPGVYPLTDFIPLASIKERRKRGEFPFLVFSGSNNSFDLTGVTIEVDTALRSALAPPVHTSEFVIAGNQNVLTGLTIKHLGDGRSPGGAALAVNGAGNTLRHCTLHVRGSFPYGYGDLFGKGGPGIIPHQKKSGLLVTGDSTTLLGCRIVMRSFGHGFFVQKDAANVRFEDCHVEGESRSTDAMLAETSGPAFKVGFRSVIKNRSGTERIQPGYVKSLSEDGFRTYGLHKNISFKNCTVKNMRGGFEIRSKTGPHLENCTVRGCERGFWISSDAQVIGCRGDAQHGPLLYVEGDNATVDVELISTEAANVTVHAIAAIQGLGNKVAIKSAPGPARVHVAPILVGFGPPGMGENMAPFSERNARALFLRNETTMPVMIGAKASKCEIVTRGTVTENFGKEIVTRQP